MRLDNILSPPSFWYNKIGIRRSSKGGNPEEVLYLPIFEIKNGEYLSLIPSDGLLHIIDNYLSNFGYYRAFTALWESDRKFGIAIYKDGLSEIFVLYTQLEVVRLKLRKPDGIEEVELEGSFTVFSKIYVNDYYVQHVDFPDIFLVPFRDEDVLLVVEIRDMKDFIQYVQYYLYWQEELEKLNKIRNLPRIF